MESILGNSTRRPDITFYRNGRIDITSRITKLMNLREGDVIDIGIEKGEFILYCLRKAEDVKGRHEAQCYSSHKGRRHPSRNLRAYSKRLAARILDIARAGDIARIWAGETVEVEDHGTAVIIIPASYNIIKQ
jgi:hypothetical protein